MRLGVISDTHGKLPARVFTLLEGVDHILHAGDIGEEEVLIDLRALAPVTVVRGNVDEGGPCGRYPEIAEIILGGRSILLVHQVAPFLDRLRTGTWQGPDILVYGHSHSGTIRRVGPTLLFNPGSAGSRRFHTIPSVGRLTLDDAGIHPELFALDPVEQVALAGA